jgi:hypothetical protein
MQNQLISEESSLCPKAFINIDESPHFWEGIRNKKDFFSQLLSVWSRWDIRPPDDKALQEFMIALKGLEPFKNIESVNRLKNASLRCLLLKLLKPAILNSDTLPRKYSNNFRMAVAVILCRKAWKDNTFYYLFIPSNEAEMILPGGNQSIRIPGSIHVVHSRFFFNAMARALHMETEIIPIDEGV